MPLDDEKDVPVCTERVEEVKQESSGSEKNQIAKKVGIYYCLYMGIVLADVACMQGSLGVLCELGR